MSQRCADSRHGASRRTNPPNIAGYGHQLYAISGWSSRRRLWRLQVPAVMVTGANDPLGATGQRAHPESAHPWCGLHLVIGGHLLLEGQNLGCEMIGDLLEGVKRMLPPPWGRGASPAPDCLRAASDQGHAQTPTAPHSRSPAGPTTTMITDVKEAG